MAYLIFTANGREYDRRELTGPIVIGRAPDCDVSIHDILLSRKHCRIEAAENRAWQITDLQSKNGTHLGTRKVDRHIFRDADELRIGRTRVTFKAGAFVPASGPRTRAVVRPADPKEALAGTVSGMVICEPGETFRDENSPFPQPRPADTKAYMTEDVYDMITEIIS